MCCRATGSAPSRWAPTRKARATSSRTLIRRGDPAADAEHAVLAVHGYTDYFFHTELADHFADRGFAFYAP